MQINLDIYWVFLVELVEAVDFVEAGLVVEVSRFMVQVSRTNKVLKHFNLRFFFLIRQLGIRQVEIKLTPDAKKNQFLYNSNFAWFLFRRSQNCIKTSRFMFFPSYFLQ